MIFTIETVIHPIVPSMFSSRMHFIVTPIEPIKAIIGSTNIVYHPPLF